MRSYDPVEQHYSQFLGRFTDIYSVPLEGHTGQHYHIVEYRDCPTRGLVTLATHGLSQIHLRDSIEEAVMILHESFISPNIITLLAAAVQVAVESNTPFAQGQVLGPAGSLVGSTTMEALFVYPPVYFPDEFKEVQHGQHTIEFPWLIPIYRSEAEWIAQYGWRAFE